MDITTGMVIISAAGHDKGQWFLVTGVDGRYAYLADGKERKLAAPKKKNMFAAFKDEYDKARNGE